jgi:acetolactate synthase-1/2/3 large subunit
MQKSRFDGHFVASSPESGITLPDTEALAKAYKIDFCRIDSPKNLSAKVGEVLKSTSPVICEVMIDPTVPSAPRLSSGVKPDGSIVSKPMEDLAPFLPQDELNEVLKQLS